MKFPRSLNKIRSEKGNAEIRYACLWEDVWLDQMKRTEELVTTQERETDEIKKRRKRRKEKNSNIKISGSFVLFGGSLDKKKKGMGRIANLEVGTT